MKCFSVLIVIVLCSFGAHKAHSKKVESLSALSLIAAQLEFLENMCLERTQNETLFEELTETIEGCESAMLNGTELTLTYSSLLEADPKEFYSFYMS